MTNDWLWRVGLLGILASAGCSSTPEADAAKGVNLPQWQGELRELYPNEIDPAAFGLTAAAKATRADKVLWARATTADVVGRARIRTVGKHRGKRGELEVYQLGIEFANPTLAAPKVNESNFDLVIEPTDEAYGMVKTHDMTMPDGKNALTDKTFVAFVKRFAGPDDQIEVHFYLYPDSADVAKVVQEAVAVDEVRKQ